MSRVYGKTINWFGRPCTLVCDKKCELAWGMCERPERQLSDNKDDTIYLSDDELIAQGQGLVAPIRSRWTEGDHNKPQTEEEKFNKWCARQCERSTILEGQPPDLAKPKPNIPKEKS